MVPGVPSALLRPPIAALRGAVTLAEATRPGAKVSLALKGLPAARGAAPPGRFAAPLRNFDEVVAEVVTSDDPIVRGLVGRTGINPSLLQNTPVGRALVAYERQQVAVHELTDTALAASLDVHMQRLTGRQTLFQMDDVGRIKNVGAPEGKSRMWNDVFSRPGDYQLTAQQKAYVDDYLQLVDEVEALRVEAGLTPRARRGEEGWFYVPRQVKTVRGMEVRRPSKPGLQRVYEEAQEGAAKGIGYETNPRANLEIHVRNAYREIAEDQLSKSLEPLSKAPKVFLPPGVAARAETAGRRMASAKNAVLAIQRAKRGEQLPTSTVKAIEAVFPEIAGELGPASRLTIEELIEAGSRAATEGRVSLPPVTPGGIRKLAKLVAETEDMASLAPGNATLQKALRKLKQKLGFAKFRFAGEEQFRQFEGLSLAQMIEMPETWYELERSTRTLLRGTQMKVLDDVLAKIRGTPYEARTATGARVTKYRGGLVEGVQEEVNAARKVHTEAMKAARAKGFAKGALFGPNQPDEIKIAQWRNRFFPLEDAERLSEAVGMFGRTPAAGGWAGRGFEVLGNAIRFLAAVGDFAMPFIQGLPLFARSPRMWARATARHYQAFFDPTVQARYIRANLDTFQEMAQRGVPIGDPEFFAALRTGGLPSWPGELIERLPKGAQARAVTRNIGKQTFGRFQSSYNVGLGVSRAELWKGLKPGWKGSMEDLAAYVRNMTGGLDSRALGVGPLQRGLEGTWGAFSPRLLRSTVALVSDLRLGIKNPRGLEAFRSLGSLVAGATGVYVLTGLGLGKSWDEIKTGLNPLAGKRFLSHQINGDWIGIGGQIRAITQLMAAVAVDIPLSAKEGRKPSVFELNLYENPIGSFYTTRGAPGLRIAGGVGEALTGGRLDMLPYDHVDNPIDLPKHIGTSALPFTLQGWLEGEEPLTSAAAIVGLRTSAETPYDVLEARAQERHGKSLSEIEPYQRRQIELAEAGAVEELEGRTAQRAQAGDERAQYYQRVGRELDRITEDLKTGLEGMVPGERAREIIKAAQVARAHTRWSAGEEFPDIAGTQRDPPKDDDPEWKKALYAYDQIFADPRLQALPRSFDNPMYRDVLFELLGEFETAHPEWVDVVERNTNLDAKDIPIYEMYRRHTQEIGATGYWEIADREWSAFARENGMDDYWVKATYRQALAGAEQALVKAGQSPEDVFKKVPLIAEFEKIARSERKTFREGNTRIDGLLSIWYGMTPMSQEAADVVFRETGLTREIQEAAGRPGRPGRSTRPSR